MQHKEVDSHAHKLKDYQRVETTKRGTFTPVQNLKITKHYDLILLTMTISRKSIKTLSRRFQKC